MSGITATHNGGLALGVGSFLAFIIVAGLVFLSSVTRGFDAQTALSIYNADLGTTITSIMAISSQYGREYFWIPIVALMGVFGKRNTKLLAIELAILFVVGIIAGEFLKLAVFRARPFDAVGGIVPRISSDSDSSFPSGHVLIVSIGALFCLTRFKGSKAKSVAAALTIEAAIVSYSRIYLGLHYPLDVLAGVFLGGAIVFVGLFVLERYFAKITQRVAVFIEKSLKSVHVPELL